MTMGDYWEYYLDICITIIVNTAIKIIRLSHWSPLCHNSIIIIIMAIAYKQ